MSIAESKAQVRTEVRRARAVRSDAERAAAASAIAALAMGLLPSRGGSLSAYLSMTTEPPTDPLVTAAREAGHRLLVPRIIDAGLEWVDFAAPTDVARGPLGIREPIGPGHTNAVLSGLDLLVLPGLAVDRHGIRLGQGGGYYDAALSSVPMHVDGGPLRAIALFDEEVLDAVPHEDLDCRVDVALTPSGIVRLS